jgi:hypothetical protein|nr:MAG TPA: hypothetical protein [Caudoviricetes sp.]
MRIYYDLKRIGFHDTIYILQRALTFAYEDYLFEPEVTFETNRFIVIYKKSDIKICMELSMCELEYSKITLEEFALRIKNRVISQYRNEMDKLYNGACEC